MKAVLIRALSLLLTVALGALLRHKKLYGERDFHTLSVTLINIVLPCVIVTNFSRLRFEPALLLLIPAGFLSAALLSGAGYLLGRRESAESAVLHLLNYTGFNIGCFALPFIQSFVGSEALLAACLFDVGNALLASGGSYALASAAREPSRPGLFLFFLRKLCSSPPLIAYFVMILLNFLGLKLPAILQSTAEIISGSNAFIAMFLLGLGLRPEGFRRHRRFILRAALVRLGGSLLLLLLFRSLLPLSPELQQALGLCLCAPVSLSCIAYTDMIGGDTDCACAWNSASILLSFPLMALLLLF